MALCRTGIVLGSRCVAGVLQIPHMMRATPHPFTTRSRTAVLRISVDYHGLAADLKTRRRTSVMRVSVDSQGVATAAIPQEIEIKLRLPDKAAHGKVASLLQPSHRETHQQENFFFDGANKELSSQRVVLRCRFYNTDKMAEITCKGRQVLKDGVGRGTEEQFTTDPIAAREFLTNPNKILDLEDPLITKLKEQYGLKNITCMGGFKNVRMDFEFMGFKLELDETQYEWGTLYEIEIETEDPDTLKPKLEGWLQENEVPYKYNSTTKFANFRNRSLI